MRRDEATLLDIATAARLVLVFKEGLDEAGFLDDVKTQSSVLHQLMVLGKAVKRRSEDFRARHPEIPWTLMAGMRDKLIHGYGIVGLEALCRTANRDVPDLLHFEELALAIPSSPCPGGCHSGPRRGRKEVFR